MVDKNGKLFGKINLIDFIILLVIIIAVVFVALRATGVVGGGEQENPVPVHMSFFGTEVPDYVLDYVNVGDKVNDYNTDTILGTIESVEKGAPLGYVVDDLGEAHEINRTGHYSVTLNLVGEAVIGEDYGFTIDGNLYGVGHTTLLYVGEAKFYVKVSAIEPIEAE